MERAGTDVSAATDALARWRHNIYLVPQMIHNDVSSTKVSIILGISGYLLLSIIGPTLPSPWIKRKILDAIMRYRLYRTTWSVASSL